MDYIKYNPETEPLLRAQYEMEVDSYELDFDTLNNLVHFESLNQQVIEPQPMEDLVEEITVDMSKVKLSTRKYKKYGTDQIESFIKVLQEEGLSVPKAAAVCGIPRSSAYRLLDEFNSGDGHVLPGTTVKPKAVKSKKLFQEHTEFLIVLFDKNPSAVLEEARSQLLSNFPEISDIAISSLYTHIREKCFLSLKQASKYTAERDSQRTLDLRYHMITQWKAVGVDFLKNCVFVDEACFHSQMMRSKAWSRVGEPAKVKVHNQKGVNISIIGCITARGILSFSKVEPLKKHGAAQLEKEYHPDERDSKERKADTSNQKPEPLKKGTTAYHIVKFMESSMDVMDQNDMKGHFIVIDNCNIHHSKFVVDAINARGYKPLFMPPYSPFLNPIEECWSKIKKNIRRNPLEKGDELTPRIAEACKTVTTQDCQDWVKHATSYWDRCLQKEIGLK